MSQLRSIVDRTYEAFNSRSFEQYRELLAEDVDRTEARELLQPIVEGFLEHRDGLDFQEAAKLLAELSA